MEVSLPMKITNILPHERYIIIRHIFTFQHEVVFGILSWLFVYKIYYISFSVCRSPFFSFEEKKKSMSNDSLNKAMEHPVTFDLAIAGPTSSEVIVRSRDRRRERRASAPPTDHRIRDSVGSLDYLSESQGVWEGSGGYMYMYITTFSYQGWPFLKGCL